MKSKYLRSRYCIDHVYLISAIIGERDLQDKSRGVTVCTQSATVCTRSDHTGAEAPTAAQSQAKGTRARRFQFNVCKQS